MSLQPYWLLCLAAAMCSAACASNTAADPRRNCELTAADSALARGQPLFRDCAVDRVARAIQTPLDPPSGSMPTGSATCYVAEVEFVVGVDGRPEPETIRLVRGDAPFSGLVLASVPRWEYRTAVKAEVPVRQIVRERRALAAMVVVRSGQRGSPPGPPPDCR